MMGDVILMIYSMMLEGINNNSTVFMGITLYKCELNLYISQSNIRLACFGIS